MSEQHFGAIRRWRDYETRLAALRASEGDLSDDVKYVVALGFQPRPIDALREPREVAEAVMALESGIAALQADNRRLAAVADAAHQECQRLLARVEALERRLADHIQKGLPREARA